MRVPLWETSPGALVAFLNGTTQAYMVDLYTLTLSGGTVIQYTSADQPITVNGSTYPLGPVIKRGKTRLGVGIAVDMLDVTMAANATVTISGVPLLQFIAAGGLDAARFVLARAFASAPGAAWVGTISLFSGRVSDSSTSRYEAHLTIASDSELLNVMIPRNVYQPGCSNTLFDGTCGLSKASNAYAATATSVTDANLTTFSTGLAQAAGYFSLGWAVCLTGPNAGTGRTIKVFASGAITTVQPWPAAVAVGNTFTVYPGCDKTQATCTTKFSNVLRFRGQPYVPAPETVI